VGLNGSTRTVCLVFTRHGLSHIYLSGYEFADLLPDIQARLSRNAVYEQHSRRTLDPKGRERLRELPTPITDGCPPPSVEEVASKLDWTRAPTGEDMEAAHEAEWREMQNRSFAPGDRSAIAERRAWVDRNRQILHVSKIFLQRDTSFVGALKEKTTSVEPHFDRSGPRAIRDECCSLVVGELLFIVRRVRKRPGRARRLDLSRNGKLHFGFGDAQAQPERRVVLRERV